MWLLIPAALLWLVWKAGRSTSKELSSAHQAVIDKALVSTNAPAISKVADVFAGEGHSEVATTLRMRAALPRRSPEQIREALDTFRAAISMPTRDGTTAVTRSAADRFRKRGLTHCAEFLDGYAKGFDRALLVQPLLLPNGEPEEGLVPNTLPTSSDAETGIPPEIQPGDTSVQSPGDFPLGSGFIEDVPEVPSGGDSE